MVVKDAYDGFTGKIRQQILFQKQSEGQSWIKSIRHQ